MSADGSISFVWGDGEEHRFRLAIGQFRELQEKVNGRRVALGAPLVGPQALLRLLQERDAWPDDVRDILRLGLLGGDMKPADVHRLLANHFDGAPVLPHMKPAFLVLMAGFVGVPDEPVESKKKRARKPRTLRSSSAASTATAPP